MGYWSHWILSAALVSALAGCASPGSTNQALLPSSWPDARYGYDPSLIREDATTLLELDAPLIAQLHSDAVQNLSTERRTQYLLAQLLGPQSTPFTYRYGQSTPARQTWYDRQGDCLSLTVLALAMAQHLRLNAIVQEVSVPANYNRRQGVDFRSGHVNLFIDRGTVTDAAAPIGFSPGLVVDFEPVEGTIRRGRPLKLDALLARYYNNAGAQALADANWSLAYTYLKQAVLHDNQFGPALTNLAWLYHQNGDLAAAEEALQLALQRDEGHETANHALYQLLKSQGRDAEARVLRATLDANRKNDPYYWINRGQEYLQQGSTDRAVAALERAQELTTGFAEVHRYLAQAYLLQGKNDKAQEQLTLLAHIDQQDPTLPTLQSKLLSKKLRY